MGPDFGITTKSNLYDSLSFGMTNLTLRLGCNLLLNEKLTTSLVTQPQRIEFNGKGSICMEGHALLLASNPGSLTKESLGSRLVLLCTITKS